MKKLLVVFGFLALGATASFGAAFSGTQCVAGTTLATLAAFGTTGCEVGDKIFSNFVYTPTGSDPAAGTVAIGIDNNSGIQQYGLQFQSNGAVWTSAGFTLTYTVTIDTNLCAACRIFAAQGAFQGALAPNTAAMTMALSGAGTVNLNDLTTNANTQQIFFPQITTTNVTITGTGASTSAPIDTFGLDVYQTSIPEPISMSLTGLGLLSLGIFGRRRSMRQ
jgi:hypothetical protein